MQTGVADHSRALLQCFDFRTVPAVPWNSGGFDAMPKMAMKICVYLPGFDRGFWKSFDHKSVPAVLAYTQALESEKSISWGGHGCKWLVPNSWT